MKLAMNVNIAGIAQALCESLSLARAAGISDETYFKALSINASRSGLSDLKAPQLRDRDYKARFSVKHMAKDLRLALETAEEVRRVAGSDGTTQEDLRPRHCRRVGGRGLHRAGEVNRAATVRERCRSTGRNFTNSSAR